MSGFMLKGRDIDADQVEDTISKMVAVSGGAITKGDLVIMNGKSGQKHQVVRASSDTSALSRGSLWVALQASPDSGYDLQIGRFCEVSFNTSAATVGDPVYLAPAGSQNYALTPGTFNVEVGKVTAAATVANGGKILIEPRAGGASISTSTTGLTFTINSDALAAANEDPGLILMGGDGGAELMISRFVQDSSADVLSYSLQLSGGAYRTPNIAIGRPGETTADLDAYLTFNAATTASAAVQSQLRFLGQENRFDLMTAATFAGIRFDGTNAMTAVFDYSQLATGEADYILGANLASAVAWRVGATDVMSIDTTTSIPVLDLDATLDIDHTEVLGARVLADLLLNYNFATGDSVGLHVQNTQFTTARTGDGAYGVRVTMTSLAGDLNNVEYNNVDLLVTDGGGAVNHNALNFGAGFDSIMDLTACLTGEADIVVGAGLAEALTFSDAGGTFLTIDTTVDEINSAYRLTTTDGVAAGDERGVGGLAYGIVVDATHTDPAGGGDAAETVVATYSIPAGTIKAGTQIRVDFSYFIADGTTAETLVMRVFLGGMGGTVIVQSTSGNFATNDVGSGYVIIKGRDAPGAAAAVCTMGVMKNIAAPGADSTVVQLGPDVTNFATNGALDLVLTADFAGVEATGGDSVTVRIFDVVVTG